MTTWTIQSSVPEVGSDKTGQAAFADTGLRIDDSVTGTGQSKAELDYKTGSTTAIKIGKVLADLQRFYEKKGREFRAYDGVSTYIAPIM